jgi:predicted DNA-binding antitoxin AbrB/MazE fold protein
MTKTVDAVFAGGVFRPIQAVEGLPENARVRLTVVGEQPTGRPFEGWVGTLPDDEAREMIQVIEEEFERVDPDEWK